LRRAQLERLLADTDTPSSRLSPTAISAAVSWRSSAVSRSRRPSSA